jgi:hypothetical protein
MKGNKTLIGLVIVVLLHAAVTVVHGSAHTSAGVNLGPAGLAFVLAVIVIGPLAGLAWMRTNRRSRSVQNYENADSGLITRGRTHETLALAAAGVAEEDLSVVDEVQHSGNSRKAITSPVCPMMGPSILRRFALSLV